MKKQSVESHSLRRTPFANRRRGEVEVELGGEKRRLVLTLGALCELEAAFDVADLVALAERFEAGRFAARDLAMIIGAGLRGAGADISDHEVGQMDVDGGVAAYAAIVTRLLTATFMPDRAEEDETDLPPFLPLRGSGKG